MWTWILSPKGRKIGIYAGIVIALLFIARWWGNHQWEKGEAKGRQTVAKEIEKQKSLEWARREKAIAEAESDVEERIKALNAVTAQMVAARASLQKSLAADIERVRNEREKDYRTAAAVPDNRVWSDIRDLSVELSRNP